MKKNKIRHYETLNGDLFPQVIPKGKNGGETNMEPRTVQNQEPQRVYNQEPLLEHDPEHTQPSIQEIWEWFGNPDEY